MTKKSGHTWDEVQAALARLYVGDHADPDEEKKVQRIEIQQAAEGESIKQEDTKKKEPRLTDVPKTTEEALDIIHKWESSCPEDAPQIPTSIAHCCMDTDESVLDQPWYGSAKDEVRSYVTEELYIRKSISCATSRCV